MGTPTAHNSPRRSFFQYGFIMPNGGIPRNALHPHRLHTAAPPSCLAGRLCDDSRPGWMGTTHGGFILLYRRHALPVGYVPVSPPGWLGTPHGGTPRNALHSHRLYITAPPSCLAGWLYADSRPRLYENAHNDTPRNALYSHRLYSASHKRRRSFPPKKNSNIPPCRRHALPVGYMCR